MTSDLEAALTEVDVLGRENERLRAKNELLEQSLREADTLLEQWTKRAIISIEAQSVLIGTRNYLWRRAGG